MKAWILLRAAVTGIAITMSTAALAGSNFEKVDLVKEGIDQKQAIVQANSNGYTSYENSSHTYYVRVFAKAKGSNSVFAAGIGSRGNMSLSEVSEGKWFFYQRTNDDGWGVYKRSVVFTARLADMPWYSSPKKACDDNLKRQMANGMSKAKVLNREWKVSASAVVYFFAGADTKAHIRNGRWNASGETRHDSIAYSVNVLCREAL